MKYTESDFYDRLNDLDKDDDKSWIVAHCICALSGAVVGFFIGYFLGCL